MYSCVSVLRLGLVAYGSDWQKAYCSERSSYGSCSDDGSSLDESTYCLRREMKIWVEDRACLCSEGLVMSNCLWLERW